MKQTIKETIKLSDYIKKCTDINPKQFKKLLIDRKIFINNFLVSNTNQLLNANDELEIIVDNDVENIESTKSNKLLNDIKIVYEDDDFIIINKPSGVLVHENNFESDNILTDWKYIKDSKLDRKGICHRLDKYTAGLLIIAKNQKTLDAFKQMFINNDIVRKYQALVLNHFTEPLDTWFLIESEIGHKHDNSLKMTTNKPKNPKIAKTKFLIKQNLKNNISLIECELLTGRTHQIRVHMNLINHPVYNDPLYGTSIKNDTYEQYLYSYYLKFIHPTTYLPFEIKIDLDDTFNNKLQELK